MEQTISVSSFRYALIILLGTLSLLLPMTSSANTFIFNPRTLTWKAIDDNGQVVRTGLGSGGRDFCRDSGRHCRTPTGTYYVFSKRGADCKSTIYPLGRGGSPMPYCMFFTPKHAIHGSYEMRHYNASHGCIRVHPSEARWLSKNFVRVGTKIVVKPY